MRLVLTLLLTCAAAPAQPSREASRLPAGEPSAGISPSGRVTVKVENTPVGSANAINFAAGSDVSIACSPGAGQVNCQPNLGPAVARQSDIQSGAALVVADTGDDDTYTVSMTPTLAAYTDRMLIHFVAKTGSSGASTLSIDNLDAGAGKALKEPDCATDAAISPHIVYLFAYNAAAAAFCKVGGGGATKARRSAWLPAAGGGATHLTLPAAEARSFTVSWQIPIDWDGGAISLSLPWWEATPGTAGEVVQFQNETACIGAGGHISKPNYSAPYRMTSAITSADQGGPHRATGRLDTADCAAGDLVYIRVTRIAGGNDTYKHGVQVPGIGLHCLEKLQ